MGSQLSQTPLATPALSHRLLQSRQNAFPSGFTRFRTKLGRQVDMPKYEELIPSTPGETCQVLRVGRRQVAILWYVHGTTDFGGHIPGTSSNACKTHFRGPF